jgi:cysteine-rich repeat protein
VLLASCGTESASLDPGTREGRDTDNDSAATDIAQPDVVDAVEPDVVNVPDVEDATDDTGPEDGVDPDLSEEVTDDVLTDTDGADDGGDAAGVDVQPDVPVAPPNCGDGVVDRDEECDDANDVDTDDCTNFCTIPRCGDGVLSTEIGEVEELEPLVTNLFGVTGHVCDSGSNCPGGACNVAEVDFAAEHGICQALGHIRAVSVVWGGDVGATDEIAPRAWNWGCFGFECDEGPRESSDGACGEGKMLVSIVCESRVSELCDDGASNGEGPNQCRPSCELPFCGDGVADDTYGEDCDDQNDIQNDGCNNCRFPSCGDGVLQPGEACDDANDDDTDGCLNSCQFPICGDGVVSEGEECDEGVDNGDFPDGCRNTCELATCGDFILDTAEECDDGNDVAEDGCSNNCRLPACGDAVLQGDEECDDGNADEFDGCSTTCLLPVCGDGVLQASLPAVDEFYDFESGAIDPAFGADSGWQIDAAAFEGGGAARSGAIAASQTSLLSRTVTLDEPATLSFALRVSSESCCDRLELFVNGTELQDWGGEVAWTEVTFDLEPGGTVIEWRYRKDGSVNTGEDAAWIDNVRLLSDAAEPEECDEGEANADEADVCRTNCRLPTCADGIVDTGEECDDGNDVAEDGCSNNCRLPACGDGVQQGGEECDDGNDDESDACSSGCTQTFCGDGIPNVVDVSETLSSPQVTNPGGVTGPVCDDGGSCFSTTCAVADLPNAPEHGICQALGYERAETVTYGGGAGENSPTMPHAYNWVCADYECTAGVNTFAADNCSGGEMLNTITCTASRIETCDDGEDNSLLPDACRPDCSAPACGDGVMDTGEECDDGNAVAGDGCSNICRLPACGDAVTQGDEECDDGNDDNDDDCSNLCELARCGDGILNAWVIGTLESVDFESGTLPAALTGDWTIFAGGSGSAFAMTNADIGDSATSTASWAVSNAGPGTIAFDRRVSSETSFDFLRFFVDGTEVGAWSGTLAWERFSYDLAAGNHTLEWRFMKDGSLSTGEDAGFVDNIMLDAGTLTTETCDDGNALDGDGCSSICQLEE